MFAPAALLPLLAQLALAPSAPASPEPTAIATSPATAIPRLQAGVGFMWLPTAVLMSGLSGERSASPAANTLGVVPSIDRRVSSHLSLGLAAPVLFNVKGSGIDGDGSNEVDLLLRLTGWLPIAPSVRLFGFAGGGGYILFVPQSLKPPQGASDPIGLAAVFGGGTRWSPAESWYLSAELGLHLGFKLGALSASYTEATQYLDLALGVGVPF